MLTIRGCAQERLVDDLLTAAGVVPAALERFDDDRLIQELVASGEGVAVVPELIVAPGDDRVSVHPLPVIPPRRLAALYHRERRLTAAADALLETIACVCDGAGRGQPLA